MFLLIPLLSVTVVVRIVAAVLVRRKHHGAHRWNSWGAAAAIGMSVAYVCAAITHFVEPYRSGFVAIVPRVVPFPELAVTASGIAEVVLATGLLVPRTRRWAGVASVIFLIAVFPANVVAAGQVAHAAAPSTPLLPRAAAQLIYIAASVTAAMTKSPPQGSNAINPARGR